MKEFKGTQGEWKQEHRIINDEGMYSTEVFSGDTVICEMKWAGEKIGNTTYSRRAENAKLIAAAPELLIALQQVRSWYEENRTEYLGESTPICFSVALSAINKATS